MARPILFSSVSREKFDSLPDSDKAKKNYQIKEEDGTVSKYISNLEGGSGGSDFYFKTTVTDVDGDKYIITVNSMEEIDAYWNENHNIPIGFVYSDDNLNVEFYEKAGTLLHTGDWNVYSFPIIATASDSIDTVLIPCENTQGPIVSGVYNLSGSFQQMIN